MVDFAYLVEKLVEWRVADVLLPFLLIFTIIFAVLQRAKIFGEDEQHRPRKNFNVLIALVMGLAVIIPHVTNSYPSDSSDIVLIINSALPNISIIIIAIVMLLLIIGVFGANIELAGTPISGWIVVLALAAVVIVFGAAANWFSLPYWLWFIEDPDTQALIVIVLIFAVVIWFITKEDRPKEKREPLMEQLGKLVKQK